MSTIHQSKELDQHYSQQFYADQVPDSIRSAEVVLAILFGKYKPSSMLDVGCGRGTWLSVAEKMGVSVVHGIDGPWVQREQILSRGIVFNSTNMENELPITRKYDLAMSVEVAEHLTEVRASSIVGALCKAADLVMFGAAVKGQGGENHVNEQRQSYWADLFRANGYVPSDPIRAACWNDGRVAPWYKQNTLVYVNSQRSDLLEIFTPSDSNSILDIIHPEMFEKRVATYRASMDRPSLRLCLGIIMSYVRSRFRRANNA